METLNKSLKIADEILDNIPRGQLEREYLAIKSGIGPTVSSLIEDQDFQSDKIS